MRDFRDAKAMAQTLRQALSERSVTLTHGEGLELIARLFGLRDWNVLAARIDAAAPEMRQGRSTAAREASTILPVLPMRDVVVFPEMTVPLFAGRAGTIRAVERAMAGDRRVLLVTQRRGEEDEPGAEALYQVGVVAEILQTLQVEAPVALPGEAKARLSPSGMLKLTLQGRSRARVVKLLPGEFLSAEVAAVPTADPQGSEVLARQVLEAFARFSNIDLSAPPQAMAGISVSAGRPALLADFIAPRLSMPLDRAQDLLETADPGERLRKILAIIGPDRQAA